MTYMIRLIWLAVLGTTLPTTKANREQEAHGNLSSDIKLHAKQGKPYRHDRLHFPKQPDENNRPIPGPGVPTGKSLVPGYGLQQDRTLFDDGNENTSVRDKGTTIIVQKPKDDRDESKYDSSSDRVGPINNRSEVKRANFGNTYFQLRQKHVAKLFLRKVLAKSENSTSHIKRDVSKTANGKEKRILLNRTKRWEDYDSNYDWENGGADYHASESNERKETKLEKWAKSWQKHALRFIFIFSFIMMFVCCCCAACKKFFQRLCEIIMMHLREWRDLCLNRDPTYRMMRKHADEYGIQLDYEEYKRIKNAYDQSLKKHGYSSVDLSGRK